MTSVSGGGGSDNVLIENTSDATTVDLGVGSDRSTIRDAGASLTLRAGAGGDDVLVENISAVTAIDLGGDNDTLTVLDAGASLTVDGGGGAGDILTVDRSAQALADSGSVEDGTAMGSGAVKGFTAGDIEFTNAEQLDLQLGSNSDEITIDYTFSGVNVNVFGNGGDENATVRNVGGPTDFVGGSGFDTLTVDIDDDPVLRTDFADRLTVSAELLIVDNTDFAGNVDWTSNRNELRASRNGSPVSPDGTVGNRFLTTSFADEVRVLGGAGDNTLTVEEPADLDVTGTIEGNRVELIRGFKVLEPVTSGAFEHFERVVDFEDLVNGSSSYVESGFRVTSSGAILRDDSVSAAAGPASISNSFTLTAEGDDLLQLRSVSLKSLSGTRSVTFTGNVFGGEKVVQNFSVGSAGFERFDLSPDFINRNLTSVEWTPGLVLTDNIVASPIPLDIDVQEIPLPPPPPSSGGTITFDRIESGSNSYVEDGVRLSAVGGGGFSVASILFGPTAPVVAQPSTLAKWKLEAVNGGPFTLQSLNVNELNNTASAQTLTFTGTRFNGDTVTQTFVTNGPGPVAFETINFGAEFTHLVSVTWTPEFVAYDDIDIVVEPSFIGGTMAFDGIVSGSKSYVEDSFRLSDVGGGEFFVDSIFGPTAPVVSPSSTLAKWKLEAVDGKEFTLQSLNVNELNIMTPAQTLTFTGTRFNGDTVTQTFVTNGPGPVAFETLNFGAEFTHLVSVTWSPGFAAYDDIVVEPSFTGGVMAFDGIVSESKSYIEDGVRLSDVGSGVIKVSSFDSTAPNAFPSIDPTK